MDYSDTLVAVALITSELCAHRPGRCRAVQLPTVCRSVHPDLAHVELRSVDFETTAATETAPHRSPCTHSVAAWR